MNHWMQAWIGVGVIAATAMAAAWLLRWARGGERGAGLPIAAGIVAGVLIGPTIMGRAAPSIYEQLMVGGVEQRLVRDALLRRQGADRLVAEHAGLDSTAFDELTSRHEVERDEAAAAHDAATRQHSQAQRTMLAACAGLVLLASGLLAGRADHRSSMIGPICIGSWAAVVPGALAYAAASWWWNCSWKESAMIAAAAAIGPWAVIGDDRKAADRAEVGGAWLMIVAGRVSSVLAICTVLVIAWMHARSNGVIAALVLLAMPIGWMIRSQRTVNLVESACESLLIPMLTALCMMRVDLFAHAAFWPLVVLALLSDDGRWLGAFIGLQSLGGRPILRSMRMVMGLMAAGPTQTAMVAVAIHLELITPSMTLALIGGALVIEITAPARRAMADRLAVAEDAIAADSDRE